MRSALCRLQWRMDWLESIPSGFPWMLLGRGRPSLQGEQRFVFFPPYTRCAITFGPCNESRMQTWTAASQVGHPVNRSLLRSIPSASARFAPNVWNQNVANLFARSADTICRARTIIEAIFSPDSASSRSQKARVRRIDRGTKNDGSSGGRSGGGGDRRAHRTG